MIEIKHIPDQVREAIEYVRSSLSLPGDATMVIMFFSNGHYDILHDNGKSVGGEIQHEWLDDEAIRLLSEAYDAVPRLPISYEIPSLRRHEYHVLVEMRNQGEWLETIVSDKPLSGIQDIAKAMAVHESSDPDAEWDNDRNSITLVDEVTVTELSGVVNNIVS